MLYTQKEDYILWDSLWCWCKLSHLDLFNFLGILHQFFSMEGINFQKYVLGLEMVV
jgi:hypothetical protein